MPCPQTNTTYSACVRQPDRQGSLDAHPPHRWLPCGQLRYTATGSPTITGHCYCTDCRKASGSGFIPFVGFPAAALTFNGVTLQFASTSARGTPAVRNLCPTCGSLVFGGIAGVDTSHTIYAGSLDDPSAFEPAVAIFTAGRPDWAIIPPELTAFAAMPA